MTSLQRNFGCACVRKKAIAYENNHSCKQKLVIVLILHIECKVCPISFERPVNYLCDAWHVFQPKYKAWTHFNRH